MPTTPTHPYISQVWGVSKCGGDQPTGTGVSVLPLWVRRTGGVNGGGTHQVKHGTITVHRTPCKFTTSDFDYSTDIAYRDWGVQECPSNSQELEYHCNGPFGTQKEAIDVGEWSIWGGGQLESFYCIYRGVVDLWRWSVRELVEWSICGGGRLENYYYI